jgi:hypothetical protein
MLRQGFVHSHEARVGQGQEEDELSSLAGPRPRSCGVARRPL